jgi:hypothetical protein
MAAIGRARKNTEETQGGSSGRIVHKSTWDDVNNINRQTKI